MTKGVALLLACLALNSAAATSLDDQVGSWMVEPGVVPPSYAVTEPIDSDVNVDTVALICSETVRGRVLELNLYLSRPGSLLPNGADPQWLKDRPSVEIAIEGRIFRADLMFADGYVIVADAFDHPQPLLSTNLLDAMQRGRMMVFRFDLLREGAGRFGRFDSQVVVDLRMGQSVIASVRQCVSADAYQAIR